MMAIMKTAKTLGTHAMSTQLRKVMALLRPWRAWLFIATIMALVVNLLEMAVPVQLRLLVNAALGKEQSASSLIPGFAVLAVLLIVSQAGKIAQRLLTEWPATRITAALFEQGVQHVLSYPLSWFAKNHSGAVQVRLDRSTRAVADLMKTAISDILCPLLGVIMTFVLIWSTSLVVGLVATVAIPLLILITVWQAKNQSGIRISINQRREEQGVRAAEAVMGIEQVKLFHAEQFEAERAGAVSTALADQEFIHHRAMARFDLFKFWIERAGFAAVLVFGIMAALKPGSSLGAGGVLMLVLLYERVADTTRHLHRIIDETNEKWILAKDYLQILDVEPAVGNFQCAPARTGLDLICENVTFTYGDGGNVAINNVSFSIAGGSKIAIVGESGSGKTTLARLLTGIYQPTAGRITIGGHAVKPIESSDVITVGMLSQEIYIFAGTVAENISYGTHNATEEDIRRTAGAASLAESIQELQNGYDTKLGQRGVGLSGGQKQRLALARVLIQNPPIVIFDEPSASLDPENARRFFDTVLHVFHEKTVIVITHDLKNLHWADQVIMLKNGTVSEIGSPQVLDEENTAFRLLRDGTVPVPARLRQESPCQRLYGN